MNRSRLLVGSLLLLAKSADGTVALYVACLGAFCWSLIGCPACMALIACYSDDTYLTTKDGAVNIKQIVPGDEVLTVVNGEDKWTKVVTNQHVKSAARGKRLSATSNTGEVYSVEITENHGVPVVTKTKRLGEVFELHAKMTMASEVSIGDEVQIKDNNGMVISADVTSITDLSLSTKNLFITAEGTAVTNGVLTGTSCDLSFQGVHNKLSLPEFRFNMAKEAEGMDCLNNLGGKNLKKTYEMADGMGNADGKLYKVQLFEYFVKKCFGSSDAFGWIKSYAEPVLDSKNPLLKDAAAMLKQLAKKEIASLDANGDGMLTSLEIPELGDGQLTPDEINPYICDDCGEPIEYEKMFVGAEFE